MVEAPATQVALVTGTRVALVVTRVALATLVERRHRL